MKTYCYSLAGILAMSLPFASVRADNESIIPSQNQTNTSAYGKKHHHRHKHHEAKEQKEHKHKKNDHKKDHNHHTDEDKGSKTDS